LDGQIVEVTQRRASTDDSDLVDLGDVTLMPGDRCAPTWPSMLLKTRSPDCSRMTSATLLLRMRVAALRAVAGGVTTIRDLGDRNYVSLTLRDWFRTGAEVGPRSLRRVRRSAVTRGHCWFLGGEAGTVRTTSAKRCVTGRVGASTSSRSWRRAAT
jgi:imidazolonepropionase-like amidohydrolase